MKVFAIGAFANFESNRMQAIELSRLVAHCHRVAVDTPCELVHNKFGQLDVNYLAVVKDRRLVGICSRADLNAKLSGRFGFSLFSKSPITNCLIEQPVVVEHGTPARELFRAALSRRGKAFHEDIALVDETGEFHGLIPTELIAGEQHREVESKFDVLVHQQEVERQQQLELRGLTEQLHQNIVELAQARDLALEASRMKSQFLAMMSH